MMKWVRRVYGGLKDEVGVDYGRVDGELNAVAGAGDAAGGGASVPAVAFAVFAGG